MSKVYVVMGTTGEYSSRSEWPVLAFTSEARAQKRVVLCKAHAPGENVSYEERVNFKKNPYDPNMLIDYTGTDYYVMAVEMSEEVVS